MKVYLVTLALFLIAFTGLAAGLILKRKGLRGGCTPKPDSGRDCQCKSETAPSAQSKTNLQTEEETNRPV